VRGVSRLRLDKEFTMRILHALLCLVFIAFVGVQYNDPDFYFWMPVYAVPALWSGLAACAPGRLRNANARVGILVCTALAVAGTLWLWPAESGFWHEEVWRNSETAREGMGMMIVTAGLALVALAAFTGRRHVSAHGAMG
jgi:hypothetical protein